MRAPSIRDVANAAGVSTGTVSRALKNQPGLAEETRLRVVAAAQQLGYDLGRLRIARLRRVTLLLHRQHSSLIRNPFFTHVMHGAERACAAAGMALSFSSVGPGDSVRDVLMPLHEPDAFLCAGFIEDEIIDQLRVTQRPIALVDYRFPGLSSVNADHEAGARMAVDHLLERGYRRIAFMHGPLSHHSIHLRMKGYRAALFARGLPADPALEMPLERGTDPERAAQQAMHQLLALPQRPDAVFAYNDACALAAMRACASAGLRVPKDIGFVGFDDIVQAATSEPPLTTLRIEKERIGEAAVALLLETAAGGPTREILTPVQLIERGSTEARPSEARPPRRKPS